MYFAEERCSRHVHGQVIPYFYPQADFLNWDSRQRVYTKMKPYLRSLEVPLGCLVSLPTIFSYKMSKLLRRYPPWWVISNTGFACCTAEFVFRDLYDYMRLWRLAPPMLASIRALNVNVVLGSTGYALKLLDLQDVIETTDFSSVPIVQSFYKHLPNTGHRTSVLSVDCPYYDPYSKTWLTPNRFEDLCMQVSRQMPGVHPTGYEFSVEVKGWYCCTYVPPKDAVEDDVLLEQNLNEFKSSELESHGNPSWLAETPNCHLTVSHGVPAPAVLVTMPAAASVHVLAPVRVPIPVAKPLDGSLAALGRYGVAAPTAFPPDFVMYGANERSEAGVVSDFLHRVALPEAKTTG